MSNVSVFGLGYVGAVTAACMAHTGHNVTGVDISPVKVDTLESGETPVLEPELERLIREGRTARRLHATTDATTAVVESEISFICVGTPSLRTGRLDTSSVECCCEQIGKALRFKEAFHWVVLRSTVLPGTTRSLVIPTLEAHSGKRAGTDFAVCVNPEFTREGSAVSDFLDPAMTVLGADDPGHLAPVRLLYEPISERIFDTSLEVAEMVKYASNAFHALKVAFANEIGSLCNELGVNSVSVSDIFLSDTKLNISPAYLTPGFAFGGCCLPKDVRALAYCAKQLDLDMPLLRAIMPSNEAHFERAVQAVLATTCRKVGVLGLSFKSGTDDLRESPSVQLVKRLLGEGRQIKIWDRDVSLGCLVGSNREFIEQEVPHIATLLSTDLEEVIEHAEVLVVGAKSLEAPVLKLLRPDQIVVDLRSPSTAGIAVHGAEGPMSTPNKLLLPPLTSVLSYGPA